MLLNLQDVPLNKIKVDRTLFQGREKAFSERSVNNIVDDVISGAFVWENLDPITLWQSPEGDLFLLSGHSRLEAFHRLAADGVTVGGKGFTRIPAKILRNVPAELAQRVALESNTLSTKENDIERTIYYRRKRQDGIDEKEILKVIKKNEGRNWPNVYAYTFLNPSGKTFMMLRQFIESEDTSAMLAKSLSRWIGQARRNFPLLTNAHEEELYNWLFEQRGYGTGANQVNSERDFLDRVAVFIQKNTFFGEFDQTKPLNIQNLLHKSPAEQEFDAQVSELQQTISETERKIKSEQRALQARGATTADVQRVLQPLETSLRNARFRLNQLLQKRAEVIEYGKGEARLFGTQRITIIHA